MGETFLAVVVALALVTGGLAAGLAKTYTSFCEDTLGGTYQVSDNGVTWECAGGSWFGVKPRD